MSDCKNIENIFPDLEDATKTDKTCISMEALILMMNLTDGDFIINVPLEKEGDLCDE